VQQVVQERWGIQLELEVRPLHPIAAAV
jgi:hypothetical protein